MIQAAKIIGTGLATTGLIGASFSLGALDVTFVSFIFELTVDFSEEATNITTKIMVIIRPVNPFK